MEADFPVEGFVVVYPVLMLTQLFLDNTVLSGRTADLNHLSCGLETLAGLVPPPACDQTVKREAAHY